MAVSSVSDSDMNLVVYRYKPEDPASIGGQKLLHTADINIGSCVTSFFRCRVRSEKTGGDKPKDQRQASWFGTLDGGIGFVLPVPEKTFRRLHMVQNMLIHCMPHYAGLNPKAFSYILFLFIFVFLTFGLFGAEDRDKRHSKNAHVSFI
ncbi:cleavage and polyadenylation specificity factor subunit 1-like [Xenia sp. Carnegie-2017]|uniref:cleavage and polyadenylation specificity factor subunit 1-like n=1 Tax=Xenia sp. Carnegie-2017 TaxID=2897299 RepID=UPI001F034FC5|nr:cleavage and polyadenylation specificity factor subunit 1-like [Xenia sp. Carnegie-2017]